MKLSKSKSFVFQEGRCPETGKTCEFKISTEKINWLHKYGPDDKFYNLQNLPFAISNPVAIFKGLERFGHEMSYCFVAKPARRFVGDGLSKPLEEGFVFLVFVSSNFEIFDWRFEKACETGEFPENHDTRFTDKIWANNP